MKTMKKSMALILAIVMVLSTFTACGSSTTEPVSETPAQTEEATSTESDATEAEVTEEEELVVFNYGFLNEPPAIDPSMNAGTTQSTMYSSVYEGLIAADSEGNIVPAAAESWTANEDKTEYVFTLRDGLEWSNGEAVTAYDFEYSWLRVIEPGSSSGYSWFVAMFLENGNAYNSGEVEADAVGVKAIDDKTLQVNLGMPASYFLQALLAGCWLPVSEDAVAADPEAWPLDPETAISNGPFKLKEYKIGSYYLVEKNENYWNADAIEIDEIKYNFITDENTALAAFEAGDLDAIEKVPTAEFVNLLTTDDRLYTYDQLVFSFLRINTDTEGLDNELVRKAISLAFDRKGYLEGLGTLTATPALGSVPAGQILDGQDFREVSGDNGLMATAQIEEAKALLEEAGYPNGEGLPVYRLHCSDSNLKAAEIVQQMLLTNLGIQTEVKPVDSKLNFPMIVSQDYDISFGGWGGDYTHPMTFLELFTTTANDNCTGWSNEEFDALIESARRESDDAVALDLMVEAEHILIEESPIVPVSFPSGAVMVSDEWEDWYISSTSVFYIKDAKLVK